MLFPSGCLTLDRRARRGRAMGSFPSLARRASVTTLFAPCFSICRDFSEFSRLFAAPMRFPPNRQVMACLLWAIFTASVATGEEPELVFSLRTWEGEYQTKDIPGGVESTPTVGAIYRIKGDGTGLTKVAQPGKDAN